MRIFWFFFFQLFICTLIKPQSSQDYIFDYLNIQIYAQDSSELVLKEVYTLDRSKDALYKKRFMASREEYDEIGRPALHLFYDTEAEMEAKVIHFYPQKGTEKGVFQQKNGAIDSVIYLYNHLNQRLSEFWTWGDNDSRDTIFYRYDQLQRLEALHLNYLGKYKRDTLIYKNQLLDKIVTFNAKDEIQQEVEFFYLDSVLLKATHRNNKRLITEEEFFYYDNLGRIARTISKLYPEQNYSDVSPYRRRENTFYKSGSLKKSVSTSFNNKKKKIGYTETRYNPQGRLIYEREVNRSAGIDKTTWMEYNARK